MTSINKSQRTKDLLKYVEVLKAKYLFSAEHYLQNLEEK